MTLNTQGWDAVCAMNAAQVSALFRQQYLADGPTSPVRPIRIAFSDDNDLMVVDVVLGPPEFSFSSDSTEPQCQLTMFLVAGNALRIDFGTQTVASVLPVEPSSSWLNGPVDLGLVQGSDNQFGQVSLDLAQTAYQPTISGIDPGSTLLTELGTDLQTYFATQQTTYPLGTIQAVAGLPACLTPTQFDFAIQPNPGDAEDGVVLLLIQTDGSGGTVGPLPTYPLPDGDTAALLVSGQVLFASLIGPTFNQEFQDVGTTFSAQLSDGSYQLTGTGGTLDLGSFPPGQGNIQPGEAYTSDSDGNGTDVDVPPSFTVQPSNGTLQSSFSCTFKQYFAIIESIPLTGHITPGVSINSCTLQGSSTTNYAATVDAATGVVSFSGTPSGTLNPIDTGSGWSNFWSGQGDFLPSDIQGALQESLQDSLQQVQVPSVDTFALQNLLFPSQQVLQLTTAAVPADLQLTGQIDAAVTVSPSTATVEPAGLQQFTATLAGSSAVVMWEVQPPLGTIDATGVYQAPDTLEQPSVVVVTAVDQADASTVGRAMVLLAPASATSDLVVTPAALTLTAGQSYTMTVVDSTNQPTDATCTLSPAGVGTLTQGFGTGQWIYTAPASVPQPQNVTISPGPSGIPAIVQVAPDATVTVTASATTVAPGGTVTLTAESDELDEVSWCVYPTGGGTITFADDSMSATYSAPASIQAPQDVTVVAWGLDGAVGAGLCRLAVQPA